MFSRRRVLLALCTAAFQHLPASAQAPAAAPVQLVVPYPAGGPTDAIARALTAPMAKALGRTVIVQNIAGASGAIAAQKVLDAAADGQLVLVGDPNATILAPLALGSVRFKPEDLVLLRNLGTSPYALVARPTLAAGTLDELVARPPKDLSFGSSGIGSLNHLAGEDLRARTRLDMVHVPYKGGAQLLQDLMGGQVDIGFVIMNEAIADLVRTGKLKMLGMATPRRVERWSAFPTIDESKAVSGMTYELWAGLMVPRGTPAEVQAALHQAANAAMEDVDVRAFVARSGVVPPPPRQSLVELGAAYKGEVARYRTVAKAAGLAPQ